MKCLVFSSEKSFVLLRKKNIFEIFPCVMTDDYLIRSKNLLQAVLVTAPATSVVLPLMISMKTE